MPSSPPPLRDRLGSTVGGFATRLAALENWVQQWAAKIPTSSSWTAPTLINSWANVGSGTTTAGYFKDPLGIVHPRGRVAGGASGSVAFQFPVGSRPAIGQDFYPVAGYNGTTAVAAFVAIDGTTGNLSIFFAAGATQIALGGFSFLAEN